MEHAQVREELPYKNADGASLSFDLHAPAGASRPRPAVILIHGGPVPVLGEVDRCWPQPFGSDPAGANSSAAAIPGGATVDLLTHPTGHHAFDILDPGERSRQIIRRTLDAIRGSLEAA
jgi:hypothetical protein